MEIESVAVGFGLGGAGGAILADFIGMGHMATAFFFKGGILGAILCAMEDINPIEALMGGM